MTREEKIKVIWDKSMQLAPKPMDMAKVNYGRTLRHYPEPKGEDYFAIVGPQSKVLALIKKDSMTNADIASAMISLGFWDTDDIVDTLTPIEQLLTDLEALKQLPDDTSAAYIKDQITEATQRYYHTR